MQFGPAPMRHQHVSAFDFCYYPVRICAAGFCVWSHRFFVYVYFFIYMAKKLTCLVPYCLKKHCWVCYSTCLWNFNTSEVFFYIQCVVQMEQFVLVLFRPALKYCIAVFHASLLCIMQQLDEGLPVLGHLYCCTCTSLWQCNLVHTVYVFCGTLVFTSYLCICLFNTIIIVAICTVSIVIITGNATHFWTLYKVELV